MSAKIFASVLLLILSSKCSGIRDGDDQKDTEDDSCLMSCNTASDAHHIQLKFNHSPGNVTPIDLYGCRFYVPSQVMKLLYLRKSMRLPGEPRQTYFVRCLQ
ncbi:hypothetical protein J1N35_006895 [Gossypium stocksii]|uniref:Secreted protein n=1 Tax=Gossypium stocksii TaxID=47602 RepID=A0A9D4ACY6_9ROSI|nr:hypothetical protein J1N35_006895 [Gossypium stocksii]